MQVNAKAKPRKKLKAKSSKQIDSGVDVWHDDERHWAVRFGELKRSPGRPHAATSIFSAFGEKIPKAALDHVEQTLNKKDITTSGVYFAHDSIGCARYAGRGQMFTRLRAHFKAHPHELVYFSFYVIAEKKHEREIETALIRVASHLLIFNQRKKRDDIAPGDVRDFEAGSKFFERQQRKGRKKKAAPKLRRRKVKA